MVLLSTVVSQTPENLLRDTVNTPDIFRVSLGQQATVVAAENSHRVDQPPRWLPPGQPATNVVAYPVHGQPTVCP